MEAARWNQIEELLQAALDRQPADRAAFLGEACAGDDELRREIETLLACEHDGAALSRVPELAAVEEERHRLSSGQVIGHYRIEERIGAGGMGEVYQARDEQLQRAVALKVLPGRFSDDSDRARRFEQEALAASRLNHPNIITIFEILRCEGSHFIATERIEGQTLRDLLRDGPLDLDRALDVTIQVASALKAAHTAWIIHRDIKPENIMVRGDGLVKVVDFGIAKLTEEPEQRSAVVAGSPDLGSDLTAAGAILGTASYMSPEQARAEKLDGRTDLFSLGLVLYEMLAGERLLRTRERTAEELLGERSRTERIPREIVPILRRLLRTDRDQRYSSAGELVDELQRTRRRLESRTARRMLGLGVLAVVVALAVAGAAAFLSIQETWEERVLRDGHTAAVRQAVFSPDGRLVVSCGEDGQVLVWDFARRQRVKALAHPSYKVAYSPDGRWVATGGVDGTVTIWDSARWTVTERLRMKGRQVGGLSFSPDGSRLAAADSLSTMVWRTAGWQRIGEWPQGLAHGALLFSGESLLSSTDLTLMEGARHRALNAKESTNWIAISPDRRQIAGIDGMGAVWFHELPTPGDFRDLTRMVRQPAHHDHGRAIAYSPSGHLVASAAEIVLLWDPATRRKVARFEYPSIVWSGAFSPDGRWLLSTHGGGAVLVWDVEERDRVASLNEHSGAVRAVAFSPDGRLVASGGEDRSVAIWDVKTGSKRAVLIGHPTRVTGVAFHQGTDEVVSNDQGGHVILWDVRTGRRLLSTGLDERTPSYCVASSPDSRFIATTTGVWERSGRLVRRFADGPHGQTYGTSFSPDGTRLASVATSTELMIRRVPSFDFEAIAKVAPVPQISVSWSPDGTKLAVGDDDGAVRLFNARPLREIAILGRHSARVKSVAFSPDGKTVASAGDDKMIALWDARTGKLRGRVGTHASPVYAIAFSPDGRHLVSGEHDRSVRLYTRKRSVWGVGWE